MNDERLRKIEQRLDRIEAVLVALSRCVHGWGLERVRFRKPGQPATAYTRHLRPSPFDAIAGILPWCRKDSKGKT